MDAEWSSKTVSTHDHVEVRVDPKLLYITWTYNAQWELCEDVHRAHERRQALYRTTRPLVSVSWRDLEVQRTLKQFWSHVKNRYQFMFTILLYSFCPWVAVHIWSPSPPCIWGIHTMLTASLTRGLLPTLSECALSFTCFLEGLKT